jgi:uncharacterized protein YecT (DUF1311 family)
LAICSVASVIAVVACSQLQTEYWIPENWSPSLAQVTEHLGSIDKTGSSNQLDLSQTSQLLADSADAQLFISYVQLMHHLDQQQRSALYKEQQAWLATRTQLSNAAVASKGGSLAPLEYNSAFLEITEARLKDIQQRDKTHH